MNEAAITKLCGFRELGENWNGYGCCAWYDGEKSEEYIRQVTTLLRTLPFEITFIAPLQDGTIVQIEYEDLVWYIEFELNEDHTASVFEQRIYPTAEREYTCYWWQIADLLRDGGTLKKKGENEMVKGQQERMMYGFGDAIELVKHGERMCREGWNGKRQYIELATDISYRTRTGEIVNVEHDAIGNAAIAFVGTSGVQLGWLASQADMLAEDWHIFR